MRADSATILVRLAEWYRGDAPGDTEPPFTPEEMADACGAGAAALGVRGTPPSVPKRERLAAKRRKLNAKLKGGKA